MEELTYNEIAGRIKIMRENAGFSQGQLADCIGVTYQQVQKYEKAISNITLRRFCKIADVLKVPIVSFFAPSTKKSVKKAQIIEHVGDEDSRFLIDRLEESKLTSDEKKLVMGFNAIKSKEVKKSFLLLLNEFQEKEK